MWEGGFLSKSAFHFYVGFTERILEEFGNNKSFKEYHQYIKDKYRPYGPERLAACCRCYLKNGKPSTFADVPHD